MRVLALLLLLAACADPLYDDARLNMSAIQAEFQDAYGWPVKDNPYIQYIPDRHWSFGEYNKNFGGLIRVAKDCEPPGAGNRLCQQALAHEIAHHQGGNEASAARAACKWWIC